MTQNTATELPQQRVTQSVATWIRSPDDPTSSAQGDLDVVRGLERGTARVVELMTPFGVPWLS
jgi:hypothetical protein